MAILGRAIQDRFPQYYAYFSTRSFAFRGRVIRGHNHLLGSVDGVDGIKTGYINASGFNIVTSVHRNNRAIIAVVFGGHTAEARDARVRSLIANNVNIASAKRTAPPVVEGWAVAEARKEAAEKAAKTAAATPLPTEAPPVPGSTDPLRPTPVKTFAVQPGARTASLSPLPSGDRKLRPAPAISDAASITTVTTVKTEPTTPGEIRAQVVQVASAGDSVPVPTTSPANKPDKAAKAHGDWMIQVGAFDSQTEALERLTTVQNNAKDLLGEANPFTERVEKGDKALFRARFAGLEKSRAETICKSLKRSEIPCMLLRN
jgi:D-alanyl-D-alanine carboxypeptidase